MEPFHGIVLQLLSNDSICSAGIIVAEMMQEARSNKELAVLENFIHILKFLPESPGVWKKAGTLSSQLRRKGITIGLADCYLAVIAKESNVRIFSMDHHFEQMKEEAGLRLSSEPGLLA